MRARVAAITVAAALGALASGRAEGQTCWFWTQSGVAFGTYDVFSPTPVDSVGHVRMLCLQSTSVTIALNRGSSSTFSARTMLQGSQALQYNLFLDAARTQIWGDGTGGSRTLGPTTVAGWTVIDYPVYGRVPPGQDVGTGSYADNIVATLTFY